MALSKDPYVLLRMRWLEDEAVADLSDRACLLFMWALSNDKLALFTGFTEVSPDDLAMVAGRGRSLPDDELRAVLDELGAKPLVRYDFTNGLLWVVNRLRYSTAGSDRARNAARSWFWRLAEQNESPLIREAWQRYSDVLGEWKLDRAA
jgi:hypothetical protein